MERLTHPNGGRIELDAGKDGSKSRKTRSSHSLKDEEDVD
jgi:hypothetical protein